MDYDATGLNLLDIYYASDCFIASPYVNLSGRGAAGDIIKIYDGASLLGSTKVSAAGKWGFAAPDFLDGRHDLYATQTDTTGAVSASSNHFVVTVDTSTPATPVVSGWTDIHGQTVILDGSATGPRPVITGKGGAGNTIVLYDGSQIIGSTLVDHDGTWSFTPTSGLNDGSHNLYVIENNLAGTSSAASNHIVFVVMQEAPTITVFGEYDVNHVNVGNVVPGGRTAYPSLQLEGYSEPGALIKVYDGVSLLGSAIAKSNGTWSFYSGAWPKGTHDLSVTQTNSGGVEGVRSEHVTCTVECYGPAAPVLRGISVWDANNIGIIARAEPDDVIGYPYANVSGRGEPKAIVTVYDGSSVLGTVVVKDSGYWLFLAPVLADGRHEISMSLTTVAGEVSPRSDVRIVNIDTSEYAAPIILSVKDSAGVVPAGHSTHDTHVVVTGTGKIGDLITLTDGNAVIGSAIVDSSRHWSIESNTPLNNGSHDLVAMSTMAAGTPEAHSDHYTFAVNTGSLAAPEITRILGYDATGHGATEIHQDETSSRIQIKIFGTGEMGSTVQVFDGVKLIGSVKVDGDNSWILACKSIGAGFHDLSAIQINTSFEVSAASEHWSFTLSTDFQATVSTGEAAEPASGAVFAGAREEENPDDQVAITPRATIISGKTRAIILVDDNTQHDAADTTQAVPLETVGEHAAITLASGGHAEVTDDPAAYIKESTVNISPTGLSLDTLRLLSDHQVLDLTSLSGKTSAAKISGIEVIDLGQHNTLKLSLIDVLNLGQEDAFRNDGKQQMMVNGASDDKVELSNSHVAGIPEGKWEQQGVALVSGNSYVVYEHTGAHAEMLVQQGVLVALRCKAERIVFCHP